MGGGGNVKRKIVRNFSQSFLDCKKKKISVRRVVLVM